MLSTSGSQTSEQGLSRTWSSRKLIACVLFQRKMFQQKLLYTKHYRTLILFEQWLFPRVSATRMWMWKSLSRTSLCSAGFWHRPWSGMQGCEEVQLPLAHTWDWVAMRSLSPYMHKHSCRRWWANKVPEGLTIHPLLALSLRLSPSGKDIPDLCQTKKA